MGDNIDIELTAPPRLSFSERRQSPPLLNIPDQEPIISKMTSPVHAKGGSPTNVLVLDQHEDYDWDELPPWVRDNAKRLGYTESHWDNDVEPEACDEDWMDLTSDQQAAARKLGYTKKSWDGVEGGEADLHCEEKKETDSVVLALPHGGSAGSRQSRPNRQWDDLPLWVQQAAREIGFTSAVWNDGGEPELMRGRSWNHLTKSQQLAAERLGHTPDSWGTSSSKPSSWKGLGRHRGGSSTSYRSHHPGLVLSPTAETDESTAYHENEFVVSLNDATVHPKRVSAFRVGGKAAGLAKLAATPELRDQVPTACALTVDFFQPWFDQLVHTKHYRKLCQALESNHRPKLQALSEKFQLACQHLRLTKAQTEALARVATEFDYPTLAAVRSSAPEEDGVDATYAGMLGSRLGVVATSEGLEKAIRNCFASLWETRVLLYRQHVQRQRQLEQGGRTDENDTFSEPLGSFALVVMEMVDAVSAGVGFSVNPLNSDRDEILIHAGWGLGTPVVDGSITPDRYVVDKTFAARSEPRILEETPGRKSFQQKLGSLGQGGGVVTKDIEETDPGYSQSSLSREQVGTLSRSICRVEDAFGMPVDVEWAWAADDIEDSKPKLLQVRPITTLFSLDPELMTQPGERRRLYMDTNVFAEAISTRPLRTMDLDCMEHLAAAVGGDTFGDETGQHASTVFGSGPTKNPDRLLFHGSSRIYTNMSVFLKHMSQEDMAKEAELADTRTASIIRSKDFDPKKYRTNFWVPKDITLKWVGGRFQFFSKRNKISKLYEKDPKAAKEVYIEKLQSDMEKFSAVVEKDKNASIGSSSGLVDFAAELFESQRPSLNEENAFVFNILLDLYNELDEKRRTATSEVTKLDYEALCGGYEGDGLTEMNIALYKLSKAMPPEIWEEYVGEAEMIELAGRIQKGEDLPEAFLDEWKSFLFQYGFYGPDQMFVGCPRYQDKPELLLSMMRLNAMGDVTNPEEIANNTLSERRATMAEQEAELKQESEKKSSFVKKLKIKMKTAEMKKRNQILEHLMCFRNSPKLRYTILTGVIRAKVLRIEEKLLSEGRLEEQGDIFHLTMREVDQALSLMDDNNNNESGEGFEAPREDLMSLVRPRKAKYERTVKSNTCPVLVDSRCRILRPDPPPASGDPSTLVGASISPGVATGIVKIVEDLSIEQTQDFGVGANGEAVNHVLCATVTSPAWTPLYAKASAVVLQIGGALQHGAVIAREYDKPAVANIDVRRELRDGMTVSVDGNTGTVTILDDIVPKASSSAEEELNEEPDDLYLF